MNKIYFKKLALRTLLILVLAHIPLLLLSLGIEIVPVVLWVGLLENIPLIFLDLYNVSWFEIGQFGITGYTREGFIVSFICKYIIFLLLVAISDFVRPTKFGKA
jgi:hypothetical protein